MVHRISANSIMILVIITAFVSNVLTYPTEVPEEACVPMLPGHKVKPQTSAAPYKVEVTPTTVKQGKEVKVVLSGKGGKTFKGYYLQGRKPDGTPVGTFVHKVNVTNTHDCLGGTDNAAFHTNRNEKKDVTIYWKAPKNYKGEITFYATFVAAFDTLWIFVKGNNAVTVKV